MSETQQTDSAIDPAVRVLILERLRALDVYDLSSAPFPMAGMQARRFLIGRRDALEWFVDVVDLMGLETGDAVTPIVLLAGTKDLLNARLEQAEKRCPTAATMAEKAYAHGRAVGLNWLAAMLCIPA